MPVSLPVLVHTVLELVHKRSIHELLRQQRKRTCRHQDWLIVSTTSCCVLSSYIRKLTTGRTVLVQLPPFLSWPCMLRLYHISFFVLLEQSDPNAAFCAHKASDRVSVSSLPLLSAPFPNTLCLFSSAATMPGHNTPSEVGCTFVCQQEIFFVESLEISIYHSHDWSGFGCWPNTVYWTLNDLLDVHPNLSPLLSAL